MEQAAVPLQGRPGLTFLSAADSDRALRTLRKLERHDIGRWALTGGFALELHAPGSSIRALNDIDFAAPDFDSIPPTLARDFLFCHVHPIDPPGKTILQCIDPATALRIDIFRACGETLLRSVAVDLPFGPMHVVSSADLAARLARLLLDLANGVRVPEKHARDYLRLDPVADLAASQAAWDDHRKPTHPNRFNQVRETVRHLISARPDLLCRPEYSQNAREICPRCRPVEAFPLADPQAVLDLLGYC